MEIPLATREEVVSPSSRADAVRRLLSVDGRNGHTNFPEVHRQLSPMVDRVIDGELHKPQRRHFHNASVVDETRKVIACSSAQSFECDREGTIIEIQESRQIGRGLQSDVAICECTRGGAIKKPNLRADDVPGELSGAARTDRGR